MPITAQENERKLLELFSPGTRFTFDGIEYESKICAKPQAQGGGGEPITDMYLQAKPTKEKVDDLILKISLKKTDWEFIKNHMQKVDGLDVFFKEFETMIRNYLERASELVRDIPVIDLGGEGKINGKMLDGAITLGWEMMITDRNRGLSLGILENRFVREAILGEHIEERRRHVLVNGDIINDSGIPTHVLEMNLDGDTTHEDIFQILRTSEEFVEAHQDDLRVILKANNYRSLRNDKTSSQRCDGSRYLIVQNRWFVKNGCLDRELICDFDKAFDRNDQSRESLEDALEQLGIDIRNVELEKVKLCDGVPENHQ